MLLIGVSGSTKCDWQLVNEAKAVSRFSSVGINPFFHDESFIEQSIRNIREINEALENIEAVFIYSAGCGSKNLQSIVKRAVARIFPKSHHYVNHDIVASALATYSGVPALSCILGTGSNCCFFDGDILRQETPALDYVLGDEGGGSYYGKRLLNAYLHKQLPEHLREKFQETFNLTRDEILENVYMKPYANVYLASFMKFIQENQEEEYFKNMVREGMTLFMNQYVTPYAKYKTIDTHFTGSIAHYFQDILKEVAVSMDIKVGKIIKEPIDDLVKYHINKHYNAL